MKPAWHACYLGMLATHQQARRPQLQQALQLAFGSRATAAGAPRPASSTPPRPESTRSSWAAHGHVVADPYAALGVGACQPVCRMVEFTAGERAPVAGDAGSSGASAASAEIWVPIGGTGSVTE